MSIKDYRSAKAALEEFDLFAARMSEPSAQLLVKTHPAVVVKFPSSDGYGSPSMLSDVRLNDELRLMIHTDAIFAAMARARAKLVANCERLHELAVVEALALIREDAPK
jgi:hypothetical protein